MLMPRKDPICPEVLALINRTRYISPGNYEKLFYHDLASVSAP
jgi:hypothetical protein